MIPSPLEGEGGRFGRMRGMSLRSDFCATTCPQVVCLIEYDLRTSRGTVRHVHTTVPHHLQVNDTALRIQVVENMLLS